MRKTTPQNQAESEQLAALLGGKTKKRAKWPLFVLAGALVLAGGGTAWYFTADREVAAETVYREYTVERGDIVVGSTESSSISLNRETISFPVSTTVEEVYVKAGSYVEEGQPLMKLNLSEIETGLLSYELELEAAGLTLDQAKLNQTKGELAAEQQYDSTKLEAEQAETSHALQIEELQQTLWSAENSLAQAEESYQDYLEQYYEDYCELRELAYELDEAEEELEDAEDALYYSVSTTYTNPDTNESTKKQWTYSNLSALTQEIARVQAEIANLPATTMAAAEPIALAEEEDATADGTADGTTAGTTGGTSADATDGTSADATNVADDSAAGEESSGATVADPTTSTAATNEQKKAALETYLSDLNSAQQTLETRAAELTAAESAYDAAERSYESFAESYEKSYGSLGYQTDYNTNISNLELQVEKAQLALEKAHLSYESGVASAEQKEETAETNADVARTERELRENEYQSAVDTAQEAYDALAAEIEEIKGYIGEDGTVYASCTGMVASIAFEAGDSFEVTYNPLTEEVVAQTLITLTDISDVYVPITISEEDILNVSIGQTASVTMSAFPEETFEAEVDTLSVESARSGAATVSYTVNVRFKGENARKMLEGMSAEVTLVQWQVQDVLMINASCVSNVGGRATVLVKGADGSPTEREVTTGFSDGRYVEILSGLSEGETVLLQSTVRQ